MSGGFGLDVEVANEGHSWSCLRTRHTVDAGRSPQTDSPFHTRCCKDDRTAGRTKGVRHTCPEPLKERGEVRYFASKGTQGKGGVGREFKAEGLSAGDSPGSDRSARPEVRGAQDEGNESGIR